MCNIWASYSAFLNLIFNSEKGMLFLLPLLQRVVLRIDSVCVGGGGGYLVECWACSRVNSVNTASSLV